MSNGQEASSGIQMGTFQVNGRPLAVGAVLVAAGAVISLAGMAIGGSVLLAATRRWVNQMDTPPAELARQQWARARAATQAGTSAWQDGLAAETRTR
jgi:hypothetical protein